MKIAVGGACGRMGREVIRLAKEAGLEVAAAIDVVAGEGVVRSLEGKADVLVDFSTPEAALQRLRECVGAKTPAVIGTTGFTDAQRGEIAAAAREIPVLLSANTSVGVNLLFRVIPEMARSLGAACEVSIEETHHGSKKDAPSGTARTLADRIEAATGRRPGVRSVRQGDVIGEHRVIFKSAGDSIEVVHRAASRDIFARGAIEAARWIARAKPGLYSMLDVAP